MTEEKNPLRALESLGQSVWLDFISRGLIQNGQLSRLIDEDGLSGITSNPIIFEEAIRDSQDYDADIAKLGSEQRAPEEMLEWLMVNDVRLAADELLPIFTGSGGRDGYVSLEVNPHLARDTRGTMDEARRLWLALDRPNACIKVPATRDGLPAIRQLIGEGINVNVTLLFGLERYREVAESYFAGLEDRLAQGLPVHSVTSVASFFLSRIDVLVDPLLQERAQGDAVHGEEALALQGKIAIASARQAFQIYKQLHASGRFRALARQGARPQRVLWASTGTKNPAYSDVTYVEALIGPDTINTMPLATLEAFRDHGRAAARLEQGLEESEELLYRFSRLGLELASLTERLEREGIDKFVKPYDRLVELLARARERA